MDNESQPLLATSKTVVAKPLSPFFATFCIVDLFGVFPVIALPRAIMDCGWMGIPLALVVFGIQIYTAVLLGRCWLIAERLQPSITSKSRYPYAALADLTFGKKGQHIVTLLLDVTVFGAGVPNLLIASQNLQLVGLKTTQYYFNFSFCYWMIILGILLCPIMWLGSPKDMKCLTCLSVVTVFSVGVLTWSCMIFDDTIEDPAALPQPTWENLAIAYGILAFQFDIHPMILTVQVDMEDKKRLGHAVTGAFIVTSSLFLITTLIALFRYGPAVRNNVLQGLPASDILYLDVLLVTAQICLSMVVGASALFQDLEDKFKVPQEFSWQRCLLRSALMIVTVLIGEVVPRFDLIMGLIGGALTGPLMFILPPLLYAKLRVMDARQDSLMFEDIIPQQDEEVRKMLHPTHAEVDTDGIAEREEREAREAASIRELFSDTVYRQMEDDTHIRRPPATFWKSCVSFVDNFLSLDNSSGKGPMKVLEIITISCIVILGVVATVSATILSVWRTVQFAHFTPPCI